MNQSQKTKQFYFKYLDAVSGKKKTRELISQYIADERLIQHILFFESLFPEYQVIVDEFAAEGDRVLVRAHLLGKHDGQISTIPATHKTVDTPFALGYKIKDEKIVDFWAIANEMEFFQQLGLARKQVEVSKSK